MKVMYSVHNLIFVCYMKVHDLCILTFIGTSCLLALQYHVIMLKSSVLSELIAAFTLRF